MFFLPQLLDNLNLTSFQLLIIFLGVSGLLTSYIKNTKQYTKKISKNIKKFPHKNKV